MNGTLTHCTRAYRFRPTFSPAVAGIVAVLLVHRRMPQTDTSREEAIKSLEKRASALHARTAPVTHDYGAKAASYGYRLMAVMLGGIFVGLAFGAIADVLVGIAPWGMVTGVLVGFGISIWMAVRSAQQMSEEAAREWGPPQDLVPEDDEED